MKKIILQKENNSIVSDDATLIIRYGELRNSYIYEFLIVIAIEVTVASLLGITSFGFWIISLSIIILWSLSSQVSEIIFDKKKDEILDNYYLFGLQIKSKNILKRYSRYKYIFEYKNEPTGDGVSYDGYYLMAISQYNSYHLIFIFSSKEDVEMIKSFLIAELNVFIR